MSVPLLDLKAQYDPIREEVLDAIRSVVDSHRFILGPDVEALEQSVADYCGTKHAIGVSSGTDALLVSLMALDVGAGDEVITTPYSFFATAGCISRLGAKPVFVDIEPVTYNINPTKIEQAITERTKAIIPVHLYGQSADMAPILETAKKHGLKVVEDGAQSIGAQYGDGRVTGSMADLGCLSFFPSKNLGGIGDGGMVLTNDPELADKVRVLRVHGSKPKYYHKVIGGNFRLDAVNAAVLSVKFKHLPSWTRQRQENAQRYETLFAEQGIPDLQLPKAVYKDSRVDNYHAYNQYVIRTPDRDQLQQCLGDAGIGTAIYYPVPFHLQECFADLGYRKGDFPESESAAEETLAIPIYPELTATQQETVVTSIAQRQVLTK